MRPKILALVGSKNAGKTRFLEHYIPLLHEKGHTVGTIKCAAQNITFDFEKYEFDVERHRKAGSGIIGFRSPVTGAIIYNRSLSLRYLLDQQQDVDYIFIEGQITDVKGFPQLVFVKHEAEIKDFLTSYTVAVTSIEFEPLSYSLFHPFQDLLPIIRNKALPELPYLNCGHCGHDNCDEMLRSIIKGENTLEDCEPHQTQSWSFNLKVNNEEVPCVHFVQNMIREALLGGIKTLKGINLPIESILLQIKKIR